jgi:hypothetical protein
MAYAAIVARAACRDTPRRTAVRPRLQERFARGRPRVEAHVQEPQPPLEERTHAVVARRQAVPHAVPAGVVEPAPRAAVEQRPALGPPCGQPGSARGPQARPVETRVGAIRLRRPDGDGARGERGRALLEAALERTDRRTPPAGQKAAGPLPTDMPAETACELGEAVTGLSLRAPTAHEGPPAVAAGVPVGDVAPRREESLAKVAAGAMGPPWRPILGLAIEGAEVPPGPQPPQAGGLAARTPGPHGPAGAGHGGTRQAAGARGSPPTGWCRCGAGLRATRMRQRPTRSDTDTRSG